MTDTERPIQIVDWGRDRFSKDFDGVAHEFSELLKRMRVMLGQLSGMPHGPLQQQMEKCGNDLLCNWWATIGQMHKVATSWRDRALGKTDQYGNLLLGEWTEADQPEATQRLEHAWHVVKRCKRELDTMTLPVSGQGVA